MFSVGSIAGFLALGLLADILGRKPTTWLYYLGALLFSLCLFLLVRDRHTLLVMSVANGFFSSGQFAWMTIYLPELFPTRVRGAAMSLVFDSSRSVSALSPLLTGRLVSAFGGIETAAAVMSLIYVVGLTVTPFAGQKRKENRCQRKFWPSQRADRKSQFRSWVSCLPTTRPASAKHVLE